MLAIAIAAAVLFAMAQAQAAAERAARAARKEAATALKAKVQADDAAQEALAELEEVRATSAKAVTDAQEAAEAAIQKAIVDRDRILAERAADMRQQIEQAKADAQAQVKAIQDQVDAAKVKGVKTKWRRRAWSDRLLGLVRRQLSRSARGSPRW